VSYTGLEFGTATRVALLRLVFLLDEVAVVPVPSGRLIGSQLRVNNSPPYSPASPGWSGGAVPCDG